MLGIGQFPLAADTTPRTAHIPSVDTTPGVVYSRYLVSIGGCQGCHGQSFAGGPGFAPNDPPVANITPAGIGTYSDADFLRAMREGKRPDGRPISETMPWRYFGKFSDGELRSVFALLQTVPPKQFREP